jgi:peptidoglycan hydrolase-like protein with peptidoglycan-binding domain
MKHIGGRPMSFKSGVITLILLMTMSVISGCATVKSNRATKVDPKVRVQQLEEELNQKDAEIEALKDQMAQSSYDYPSRSSSSYKSDTSTSIIGSSISGVSVKSIQKALKNAGYYTGSVDGQAGAKTKKSVKAFQRAKGLTADGVVGKRTWVALSRYL